MRRVALATVAALLAGTAMAVAAQETPDTDNDTEEAGRPAEPTVNGNGAQVLRGSDTVTETTTDGNGNQVTTETTTATQTVTTPSGNVITQTKTTDADGNRTVNVQLDRAEHPGRTDRPSAADRPDRPERAEAPERPEHPEKPEHPEHP